MKSTSILTIAALLLSVPSLCQRVDLMVHFPKGSDAIEFESISRLKIWAAENHHKRHDHLILRGHTDKDAGDDYNLKLSERRNQAVSKHLFTWGYDNIHFTSYGETWPYCNSEDELCMHENRRVEVVLYDLPEEKLLLNDAENSPNIHFTDPAYSSCFVGKQGTKISIPENAFVHADGSLVKTPVRLHLKEYYTVKDCIKNHLTTTCNQQMIESGGMIHLSAFTGKEEVFLAPTKSLEILFASQAECPEEGMQTFNGELLAEGLNWSVPEFIMTTTRSTLKKKGKEVLYNVNAKHKNKDGAFEKEFFIGGKDVTVTYGPGFPTIAKYKSYDKQSLTADQKLLILDALNKTQEVERNGDVLGVKTQIMGWINCDRFISGTDAVVAQYVITDYMKEATYMLVFDEINSIMPSYLTSDGRIFFPNVPIGKKAFLVCYEKGEKKSLFGLKHIDISSDPVEFTPVITANEKVDEELEKFNFAI